MKYAADHPDRIKGLVVMEGMIMPAYEYYQQLSFMQKMLYALFRNRTIARSILINGTRIRNQIVPMMTLRRLSTTEQLAYTTPYATDPEKRKVVFDGPGPVGFPQRADLKPETARNESVIMMNETARKLTGTPIPMLLLYANPGVILSEKGRRYARQNYPNLTLRCVGRGKHFLAEDQPKAIGRFIREWLRTIQ